MDLFVIIFYVFHQCNCKFATNFDCKELKQPPEFVSDVKNFVRETANFFNRQSEPDLDLSTIGLGFIQNGNFMLRTYHKFLSLDLSRNVIRKIEPKFIQKFPTIQNLDLSRNCLTSILDSDRLAFLELHSLNLSRNLITQVHALTFANLTLDTLDLSHNLLIRFWSADYEISQLFLNDNKITQIEIDSKHFKEMKILNASNNKIRMFQVSVDFEDLILTNNHLTLDEYFSIRSVYGTLDLSKNHINEFDWKIISCVTNLNLSSNRLSIFRLECPSKRFPRMERLNLNRNFLCTFEKFVDIKNCLPNLKLISLVNNRLTSSERVKIKGNFSSINVKSLIYEHEFFPQIDDEGISNIFRE